MITEDQLEQLAIQWFQDTGWNYVHGAVIAPEGVAAEREALRSLTPALSHWEKEEDGRLAEAVRRLNPFSRHEFAHLITKSILTR
jgi:type I restriction enzyme R subunit